MPRSVEYKKGSIVYFNGDRAEKVYVLQSGRIEIVSLDLETNEEVHDFAGPGEFFGVKSAMGGYPREDSITVLSDAKVMVFTVPEFESFCIGNPRIVMKMLKVFSNQLRQVNKQLSNVLQEKEADADDGLYNVGEFFLKQNKYEQAYHVLERYIKAYPQGKNIVNAQKNFEILKKKRG